MDEVNETDNLTAPEAADSGAAVSPPIEETAPTTLSEPWQKVRELALKQLDRFVSFEPKVLRGDDPDAIHDIRVASRRLQQILDLLHPAPRPREIRRLRRKIRRCRRALGEVRNCDVLIGHVERMLARKRVASRETWTAVSHYLRQRRAESFENAVRKLSKVNLAVFYVRLKDWLASDGAAPEHAHPSHKLLVAGKAAPQNFHERVTQDLEEFWQAFEAQIAQSQQDPRTPVIHGVRVAAKRVRYLIEVVHAFEVPGSAEAVAWLRQLQQHMGNWHDLEVLEQMMLEMIARPEFLHDHLELAMKAEKQVLRLRGKKKGVEGKYFEMARDSAGFGRVKDWVRYLVSSPSAAFTAG